MEKNDTLEERCKIMKNYVKLCKIMESKREDHGTKQHLRGQVLDAGVAKMSVAMALIKI